MQAILIYIICFISLLYFLFEKKTSRSKKMLANLPQFESYPIIGCALTLLDTPEKQFQILVENIEKLKPVAIAWLGTEVVVCLSSVEHFECVYTSKNFVDKPFFYSFLDPWLSSVSASGEDWRRKKNWLAPAFRYNNFKDYLHMFNSSSLRLLEKLKNEVGKPGFNVTPYAASYAIDATSEIALGMEMANKDIFDETIITLGHLVMQRIVSPWNYSDLTYWFTKDGRHLKEMGNLLDKSVYDVINAKLQERTETKMKKEVTESVKEKLTFLETLIENKDKEDKLTIEEIKNVLTSFTITGTETSSNGLSSLLYFFTKNQQIQENARRELDEIFEDSDRMPTNDDLIKMKYLDQCIKEALRLWPPIPFTLRSVADDTTMPDGIVIPKGSTVLLSIYHLLRNPKEFPDPEVFNPDRFNEESVKNRNPYAYSVFSGGQRICPGRKFGITQIKVAISSILRNFKVLPSIDSPDIKLAFNIVLTSTTGIYIKLVHR